MTPTSPILSCPEAVIPIYNIGQKGEEVPFGGGRYEHCSPYFGQPISCFNDSTPAQIDEVVAGAVTAWREWSRVPLRERCGYLFALRSLVTGETDAIATTIALESGKTIEEGRAEIAKGIEIIEFALSLQNEGRDGILEVSRGVTCEYRREPLGVCLGVVPFNFPAMIPLWMIPLCITLGNSFILKPSEKVPATSQLLARLIHAAGYPPGVFSVLHGGQATVEALVDHPQIAAVGFVGSSPVARALYGRVGARGGRALCLGGAKNHIILLPDAEPTGTIDGIVASFTGCAGQRCMAASVLVVVGNGSDGLVDGICTAAAKIRVGVDMGAIITPDSVVRLRNEIAIAEAEGARVVVDGRDPKIPERYQGGNWLAPTIIDGVKAGMGCVARELFGPILSIVRVSTIDEALALEANSPFGNAVSIFTSSAKHARYVACAATSGMVGINIGVPVPREPFSFGGTKSSKFGVGDITGAGGVAFWSDMRKITTKWGGIDGRLPVDANWMNR